MLNYLFLIICVVLVEMSARMPSSAALTVSSIAAVRVRGSGVASINTDYHWTSPENIPPGFAKVCLQNSWNVESTWKKLNAGRDWLRATNESYIYLNNADGNWWIDEPGGMGIFIAPAAATDNNLKTCPPTKGWKPLSKDYMPAPIVEIGQ